MKDKRARTRPIFAASLTALTLLANVASSQLRGDRVEGTLTITWGDPRQPGDGPGETLYTLTLADGTSVPLRLNGLENVAGHYFGRRVVVAGNRLSGGPGTANDALVKNPIRVESIEPAPPATFDSTESGAPVVGTKKVLFLLLKFADDSAVPHPPTFYTNLTNFDTPPGGELFPSTINGFFKKTSWNQFSWVGSVGGAGGVPATGWLTLPSSKSAYAPCGFSGSCANLTLLRSDALALAGSAGINIALYDNINFVLSNDLDCCAWGGSFFDNPTGKVYGQTFAPPWAQDASLYAHEMGHSIGLPHSGWVYSDYDSPWDTMSDANGTTASSPVCGSYFSRNDSQTENLFCREPGGGYIAAHKDVLGWIAPSQQVVMNTITATTVTLEASALPLSATPKMLKICTPGFPCTGSTARYLTVEARVKGLGTNSQFDNGIPGDGVIIHSFQGDRPAIGAGNVCFFNNQSGWAVPIDATPGDWEGAPTCSKGGRVKPNYGLYNAQWLPGQTYVDPATGASIAVKSRVGSSFNIEVSPLSLTVNDPSIVEGGAGKSALGFTLTLSAASTTDTSVHYATSDGTASSSSDYTAASGTFTIPAGSTSKVLTILVNGDATIEPNETVTLTLSAPVGAVLSKTTATGTIVNDDPAGAATTVTQYRLYHDGTKEHLYTTDLNEYNVLGTVGWTKEGVAYKMLTNGAYSGVTTVPLFRLYHPGIKQHHWTTDSNEASVLSGTSSWFYEGIIGYLLPTQAPGTVPLYRMALANPPLHLWTTDLNEYNTLAAGAWTKEGVVGYIVP